MIRDYDVRHYTTAELERAKRDLMVNLGMLTPNSPAHVPVQAHMKAIDAELAERTGYPNINGSAIVSTGEGPAGCDPLIALSDEYQAEWKVSKPGRYVADHRRLDVTLTSDSVSGLAEKLRAFTELVEELP